MEEKLLFKTADEFAYRTVKQILEDNKIPYFVRDDESGGYMNIISGFSIYERRIYVSSNDYYRAFDVSKEFIEGIKMEEEK